MLLSGLICLLGKDLAKLSLEVSTQSSVGEEKESLRVDQGT